MTFRYLYSLWLLCALSTPLLAQDAANSIESKRLPPSSAGLSPRLTELPQVMAKEALKTRKVVPVHKQSSAVNGLSSELSGSDVFVAKQQRQAVALAPAPLLNFEGLSGKDNNRVFGSPSSPSDVNGDVGLSHYVQMVNNLYRVYDKQTGKPMTNAFKLSSLFAASGLAGPCATEDQGDPIVLYDGLADRWLLSQFNYKGDRPPYHECIAVSSTGDPTGSYYVYDFVIPNNRLGDYPKFGVWHDGYYMTMEEYVGDTYKGEAVMVFDRQNMLQGKRAGVNYHGLAKLKGLSVLLPSDIDGAAAPTDMPNYLVALDNNTANGLPTNKLRLFAVQADFSSDKSTGSIIENSPLTVAPFQASVCAKATQISTCISQPLGLNNKSQKLDSLSDRPMYRLQYRYFAESCPVDSSLTHCSTLVFNHTVRGKAVGAAAVRWYLLLQNPETKAIRVAQQGTFAPDNRSRWMGSAALNKWGDLAIGYSLSSSSTFPSIAYAGRLSTDLPNTLSLEGIIYKGHGSQRASERWGDYSSLSVDPVDECTFWYTNQYYANNSDGYEWFWQTRIASFKLSAGC